MQTRQTRKLKYGHHPVGLRRLVSRWRRLAVWLGPQDDNDWIAAIHRSLELGVNGSTRPPLRPRSLRGSGGPRVPTVEGSSSLRLHQMRHALGTKTGASRRYTHRNPFVRNVRTACAACGSTSSISIKSLALRRQRSRPRRILANHGRPARERKVRWIGVSNYDAHTPAVLSTNNTLVHVDASDFLRQGSLEL